MNRVMQWVKQEKVVGVTPIKKKHVVRHRNNSFLSRFP